MQHTHRPLSQVMAGIALSLSLLGTAGLAHADDSTYQQFGGKPGLSKIVEDFIGVVVADARIAHHFKTSNLPRLRAQLTDQLCELTGGPCEYGGADMKTSHRNMKLSNADFNALAEDLQVAMERAGVPSSAQNKLLAKLAPMQRDIVTR